MNHIQSVSSINAKIKSLLETTFSTLSVEGELSNITYHGSGHIYFSIKDDKSSISAVMFRGNASKLKFKLQRGDKIILHGAINLYEPRGQYQLIASSIEPSGIGSLALAFEQLKKRLDSKGYFDINNKKSLPSYPKSLAIVTSLTGAALQDMLKVAQNRYKLISIKVIDTIVQGDNAGDNIASNIDYADGLGVDLIIVGRGGGSIEDLWGFNQEVVADAIYMASTPIISAVGHEVDYVISDYVADIRAATPSNAIEIALPSTTDIMINLDDIRDRFSITYQNRLNQQQQILDNLYNSYKTNSYEMKLNNQILYIKQLKEQLNMSMENIINKKSLELKNTKDNFIQNSPKNRAKKGYAQATIDNKAVEIKTLKKDDIFNLSDASSTILAKVL